MVDVISSDTQDRMRQNEEGKQPRPRFFIRRVLLVACLLSLSHGSSLKSAFLIRHSPAQNKLKFRKDSARDKLAHYFAMRV